MLLRSIALALLSVVVGSTCVDADEPAGLPPMEVKLVEAGQQPRRVLRLQIKQGSQESIIMATKMSMATEVNGQKAPSFPLPTMEMTMQAQVKQAGGKKIAYTFELTEAKVLEDEKVPDPVRKAMVDALTRSVGIGGEATIDDRGRTLAAKMNVPPMAPADVKQMIDSMERSLQNFGAPLPDEAVGVGGKWEVKMTIEVGGMRLDQTATYTLTKLLEDGFAAQVSLRQTADKQPMKPPGLPAGVTIELQKLSGEGTGTIEVHLNRLAPSSKIDLASSFDAIISAGGMEQAMKSSNSTSIAIRPK